MSKKKHHAPDPPDYAAVSECAYALWERAQRPEGQHLVHWFRAENELRDTLSCEFRAERKKKRAKKDTANPRKRSSD